MFLHKYTSKVAPLIVVGFEEIISLC